MHDFSELKVHTWRVSCILLLTDLNNFNIKNICHVMSMFFFNAFSMSMSLPKGSKQLTVAHMELNAENVTTLAYKTSLSAEGIC